MERHWSTQRALSLPAVVRSPGSATLPLAAERLSYHALLAGLQALLVEDYVGALIIAAEMAFIALLRQSDHVGDPGL